jgi:hypothetical protein
VADIGSFENCRRWRDGLTGIGGSCNEATIQLQQAASQIDIWGPGAGAAEQSAGRQPWMNFTRTGDNSQPVFIRRFMRQFGHSLTRA